MSTTTVLEPEDYPLELCVSPRRQQRNLSASRLTDTQPILGSDIRVLTFHGPVPIRINLAGREYLLDTDHHVRRTTLTPPPPPPHASSDGKSAPVKALPLVQERWHSLTRDGTRGVDVTQPVAHGLGSGLDEDVDEIGRAGTWRTGLEEVERRCCVTGAFPAVAGATTGSPAAAEAALAAARADGGRLFARVSRPSPPLL